ncbi:UPF0729 protein AAEL015238 [Cydia strobilella]|uniref:UPF0729 protein AAEL015238 n=1 Tax=Cydia strobilella TaxID=1100964 RepID=UPI003005351E
MVCVPCFIIPVLLLIWHRFIQPYVLRFWNPWAVKDADGNVVKTEAPFSCEGGVCMFGKKKLENKADEDKGSEASKDDKEKCNERIKAE